MSWSRLIYWSLCGLEIAFPTLPQIFDPLEVEDEQLEWSRVASDILFVLVGVAGRCLRRPEAVGPNLARPVHEAASIGFPSFARSC
jgi:hypothetical protein